VPPWIAALATALAPAPAFAVNPPPPGSPALAAPAPPPPAAPAPPPPPPPSGDVTVSTDHGVLTPLPDGVVVAFEPGATARWRAAGKLASESAKWAHGFHLELTDGEIDVAMPAPGHGEHAFLLTTRAGTLTVWRGHMHARVRGDATAVSVYEGALVVGSNRQSFAVRDAKALVLHKGSDPDRAGAIPGLPTWDESAVPSSFAIAPEGAGAMLGLSWTAPPGAASYRVQIAEDPAMTRIVRSVSVGDPRLVVPAPAAGAASWAQVRAVGADGILGDWSAPRALRVAHYRLPSGAFLARDGVVVMPEGTSLSMMEPESLEVAYENVRAGPPPPVAPILYWSRLTGALRLADDAPLRIAHVRDATLGVESRVALAKRQIRADVELRPRQARPADPIDVRAVVWDPSGRIDVSTEAVSIEAMADLDALPVAWQRTANVWTGRIGPRRDTGRPSVVRVVVRDGLREEIGRGFVEIGGASQK
jgi:hypothetical protein